MTKDKETLGREMQELVDEAQKLVDLATSEERELTEEEQNKFDDLMKRAESHRTQIQRLEKLENHQKWLDEAPVPAAVRNRIETGTPLVHATPVQHCQLRAFKEVADTPERCREAAIKSGMWIRAVLLKDPMAREWCTLNAFSDAELRAMEVGVATSGGTLVPDEFERAVIDLRKSYGVARQECRVVPMGSDTMTIPRMVGNTTVYFPGEGGSITASDRGTDAINLVARKAAVLTKISTELAEDAVIDIAEMLANDMAWAFAKKEDECLIDGDGSTTYGGIVGIRTKMVDGNHTGSYLDATAGDDQWSEYIVDDFAALQGTLPDFAEANAKWYCHKICFHQTMVRLAAAAGGSSLLDIMRGVGGQKIFLGDPVVLMNAMPSATTALNEKVVVLYGDMRQAVTFGDRRGIRVEVLRERYADSDQIGVKATERFDIVVHDITQVDDSTAPGALIGLRGNTS